MGQCNAIELFAGAGGMLLGLEMAGFTARAAIERDEYCCQTLQRNKAKYFPHATIFQTAMEAITPAEVLATIGLSAQEVTLISGGPPCFVAETPIITQSGIKPISQITVGDTVLTHKGTYQPVTDIGHRLFNGNLITIKVKGQSEAFTCTDNHPILTREYRILNCKKICVNESFVAAGNLEPDTHYVALPITTIETLPRLNGYYLNNQKQPVEFFIDLPFEDPDFWYLIGFYVADGWYRKCGRKRHKNKSNFDYVSPAYQVSICANYQEAPRIKKLIEKFFNTSSSDCVGTIRYTITNKHLWWFVKHFGDNAHSKGIPEFIHQLPRRYLQIFLEGWVAGDGYKRQDHYGGTITCVTTSSPALVLDLVRIVAKVYYIYARSDKMEVDPNKIHKINNRIVHIRSGYQVSFRQHPKRSITWEFDGELLWIKVDKVIRSNAENVDVWNLEVANDHTYTTPLFTSHNCQGFSIAVASKGGRQVDDPRNNMFMQFAKFLKAIKPPAFLMENVPGLTSIADGYTLKQILKTFRDLGYQVGWKILNAANYGVPQIRKRFFVMGFAEVGTLPFPHPTHSPFKSNLSGLPPYRTIREALQELTLEMPNQDLPHHRAFKVREFAEIKQGVAWQQFHFRDKVTRPSRTITGHCRDDWIHPTENRSGTVRELATLQAFPHDYVFEGPIMALNNVPFNFQYRQVGNAVPVLLAKALGEAIRNRLFKNK